MPPTPPQLLALECVPKLSEGTFLGKGKADVVRHMRILKDRIVDVYAARGTPLELVRLPQAAVPTMLRRPRLGSARPHPCARRAPAAEVMSRRPGRPRL